MGTDGLRAAQTKRWPQKGSESAKMNWGFSE
jgi:hypothetical protein